MEVDVSYFDGSTVDARFQEVDGNLWKFPYKGYRGVAVTADFRGSATVQIPVSDYCTTQSVVADYRVSVNVKRPWLKTGLPSKPWWPILPRKRARANAGVSGLYTKQTVAADYRERITVKSSQSLVVVP